MNPLQAVKYLNITPPAAAVDDASFVTAEIDRLGFDYCTIVCILGSIDATMAALKVQESDTSGAGFTDVSGTVFGTDKDIDEATAALPIATDDNKIEVFQIDCRHLKRYLDVVATAGNGAAGTFMCILAILSKAKEAPNTSAEAGAEHVVRV